MSIHDGAVLIYREREPNAKPHPTEYLVLFLICLGFFVS
jgi:hypothetical protein